MCVKLPLLGLPATSPDCCVLYFHTAYQVVLLVGVLVPLVHSALIPFGELVQPTNVYPGLVGAVGNDNVPYSVLLFAE